MKCSCQRNEDEEIVVLCPEHKALIAAEREACALVAETTTPVTPYGAGTAKAVAAAIRARQ